jgi:ribosome-associated protein
LTARHQEDSDLSPRPSAAPVAAAAQPVAAMTGAPPAPNHALLAAVVASLEDDKAEDIVTIDLQGRSEMADFMVICSGRSTRQVAAISDKLTDRLKQDHDLICKSEGKETGDWVLIDAGDVIVHVFRPEVREFYQLEKMWLPGSAAAQKAPGTA